MKNAIILRAEAKKLTELISAFTAEGKMDDALKAAGKLEAIEEQLDAVLAEEDSVRAKTPSAERETLAESILGIEDEFTGIGKDFTAVASRDLFNAHVTMPGKVEHDYSVPSQKQNAFYSFVDTLAKSNATGQINYMRAMGITGDPATWTEDQLKALVLMRWEEFNAPAEVVAGYVPVSEVALEDYGQLQGVIEGDLIRAYYRVLDNKVLNGTNASGITGILNTAGIQTFTDINPAPAAIELFDNIRKMKTRITRETGLMPTHVAMSPEYKEILDLHKTNEGFYQFGLGGAPWGMQVIEDVNMDGLLVYVNYEAELVSVGRDVNIAVGTIDDQFVKNQLSIRAEGRRALKVKQPAAFVYAKQGA